MPSKKTTMIQEESSVEENDSKAVLAYRVGQLEKTTASGLREIKDELHRLQNSFVTSSEMKEAKDSANTKHLEQDGRITKLENWNEWAVKIVFAIIISAVLAVIIAKPTIGG